MYAGISQYVDILFWCYFNRLELAEELSESCGSLTETQKIYLVLVLQAGSSQIEYIDILFWGYFNRLELAEKLFRLSMSSTVIHIKAFLGQAMQAVSHSIPSGIVN